ncbi:FAS1 domain-containing protein [Kalaharituber pfeilii]|nr:FAS1 domain-containing protein [Kalaharituber pfeilii]
MRLRPQFHSFIALSLRAMAVYGQSLQNLTSLLTSTPELSALTELVFQYPDLVGELSQWPSNVTILAPSNKAFDELMTLNTTAQDSTPLNGSNNNNTNTVLSILQYHVLNGAFHSNIFVEGETAIVRSLLMTNGFANLGLSNGQVVLGRNHEGVKLYSGLGIASGVETPDIEFDKGVVHIIDRVLTLPYSISQTAAYFNLSALAGALVRTGLVEALDTTPSLTVFAPSNVAFQAIGNLADELTTEQLADILKYHVVNRTVYDLNEAQNDLRLATLEGGEITIHENEGGWFVNGARIIGGKEGGVVVANGVIYIIDNVLNPSHGDITTTYTPNPTLSTQPPAFTLASYVTHIPFTSELVSGTPTTTTTGSPTQTVDDSAATALELALAVFMTGFGAILML